MSDPYTECPEYVELRADRTTVCPHGSLRRSCSDCEVEVQDLMIERLHRRVTELEDGTCRFNCRTGKRYFARGAEWAAGFLPDGWEAAYTELREREKCTPTR